MCIHPNRRASFFLFLVALNAWLERKVRLSTKKKLWQVAFAVLLNMYDSSPKVEQPFHSRLASYSTYFRGIIDNNFFFSLLY